MPLESAHFIFDRAPVGTTVQIVDSWSPPAAGTATRWCHRQLSVYSPA